MPSKMASEHCRQSRKLLVHLQRQTAAATMSCTVLSYSATRTDGQKRTGVCMDMLIERIRTMNSPVGGRDIPAQNIIILTQRGAFSVCFDARRKWRRPQRTLLDRDCRLRAQDGIAHNEAEEWRQDVCRDAGVCECPMFPCVGTTK